MSKRHQYLPVAYSKFRGIFNPLKHVTLRSSSFHVNKFYVLPTAYFMFSLGLRRKQYRVVFVLEIKYVYCAVRTV